MSLELITTVLTSLVGVGVSVLLAGIPWAYSMHGRLTRIEATLAAHLSRLNVLNDLELRVARLEFLADPETNQE